jgi:hypothetical protein
MQTLKTFGIEYLRWVVIVLFSLFVVKLVLPVLAVLWSIFAHDLGGVLVLALICQILTIIWVNMRDRTRTVDK